MSIASDYPSRYYAYANQSAKLGGYPTAGWVDTAIFSAKPDWLPPASDMIALTEEQWNSREPVNQIIKDGAVQTYAPDAAT